MHKNYSIIKVEIIIIIERMITVTINIDTKAEKYIKARGSVLYIVYRRYFISTA